MQVDITFDNEYFVLSSDYIFELNVIRTALTREIPNAWMLKKITSVQNTDRCFMNNYNMVPVGLWLEIIKVCKENNIQVQFTERAQKFITDFNFVEFEEFKNYVVELFKGAKTDKGKDFMPYDYQIEAAYKILKYRKCCAEVSTSGGKTLISFIIFKYLYEVKGLEHLLFVVPTKGLVNQSKGDFEEYESFLSHHNKEYTLGLLKSGLKKKEKEAVENCNMLFGTFQSLTKKNPEFLSKFHACLNDECCHPDTLITMADHSQKKIKDVQIGDKVLTFNEELKIVEEHEVEYVYKNLSAAPYLYEIETDNQLICVTGNHKILTTDGYVRADKLTQQHILCRLDENEGPVEEEINYIFVQAYDGDVYNLRIKSDNDNNHNYFANEICISNCHHVASSASIKTLLNKCTGLIYSFGVTGTFPRHENYEYLTLQAYIGPVVYKLTANQLINEEKRATPIYAIVELLNYASHQDKQAFYLLRANKDQSDIQAGAKILKQERLFVNNQYTRLKYIGDKAISTKKNTLVLFGDIKYGSGQKIYDYIKDNSDKNVYYADGTTPEQNRKYYMECMENDDTGNTIIVASINTFGEGINIKNLWSIFLVDTAKSERLVRQICGRGLRLYPGKDKVLLFDFVDDLRYTEHPQKKWKENYLYKHGKNRESIYKEQNFPVYIQTVNFQ